MGTFVIGVVFLVGAFLLANWLLNPGGFETRNCLKRLFGDQVPTCSDVAGGDGTLKRTTLNGVDLGPCRYVSNDGCIAR